MSLPHFTTGLYDTGQQSASGTSDLLCKQNRISGNSCDGDEPSSLQSYLFVFIAGQVLHGLGGTTLYTLGIVFMDENISNRLTPLYVGILYAGTAFGPAVGFVLGGQLLSFYTDFDQIDTTSLTIDPDHPSWVGAWWLGFLLSFCLALLISLALFGFPRKLPEYEAVQAERFSEAYHSDSSTEHTAKVHDVSEEQKTSLANLFRSIWLLLKNPTFLFCSLTIATEGMVSSGVATFGPKYIQNQMGKSAGTSAILAGAIAVPGIVIGTFLGGLITSKMKLKVGGLLKFSIIMCLISCPFFFSFALKCDNTSLAGVSVDYSNNMTSIDEVRLSSGCNEQCRCSSSVYEPVCSADGVQFFSACYAGCTGFNTSGTYTNCSCSTGRIASDGNCPITCGKLYAFLAVFFLAIFFTFAIGPPTTAIILRAVDDEHRALALGVQAVIFRLLGTVPGPVLYGAVIDSSCVVWQEKCAERGSCWVYDNAKMSWLLAFLCICIKLLSLVFLVLSYWLYKAPELTISIPEESTYRNLAFEPGQLEPSSPEMKLSSSSSSSAAKTVAVVVDSGEEQSKIS